MYDTSVPSLIILWWFVEIQCTPDYPSWVGVGWSIIQVLDVTGRPEWLLNIAIKENLICSFTSDTWENCIEHKIYVLFPYKTFVWSIFGSNKYLVSYTWNTHKNTCRSSCKVLMKIAQSKRKFCASTILCKILQCQSFTKIWLVVLKLFHMY
jgi:hypothetical protein